MTLLSSSGTAGDAQYAVSVTGNLKETKAEINTSCTPTCSTNGTYSDGYTGAFEGPEKLLEMWFAPTAEAAAALSTTIGQETNSDCDDRSSSSADENDNQTNAAGLRSVPVIVWRDMLDLVHCQILSTLRNAHVDSYLLSESSFFVYPHKLVLKTCGTTTLLYAIPRMLEIAGKYLGTAGAHQLFYSRKNFMFPEQQVELHRSWEKEVSYLDALFPDGSAYMIGKTNRDHWHVYLAGPYEVQRLAEIAPSSLGNTTDVSASSSLSRNSDELLIGGGDGNALLVGRSATRTENGEKGAAADIVLERASPLTAVASDDVTVNNSAFGSPFLHPISRSSSRSTVQEDAGASYGRSAMSPPIALRNKADTTVEILMTGLDPERMRTMYLGGVSSEEGSIGGKAVERDSGIAEIYPKSASDSFLFSPCGFSLNGLQGDGYYTIHVTPEPHCSYASFETNVADDEAIDLNSPGGIKKLVEQVTCVFGPRC
ncbi:spermidine resistance protein, partial [Coemansia erecta]